MGEPLYGPPLPPKGGVASRAGAGQPAAAWPAGALRSLAQWQTPADKQCGVPETLTHFVENCPKLHHARHTACFDDFLERHIFCLPVLGG